MTRKSKLLEFKEANPGKTVIDFLSSYAKEKIIKVRKRKINIEEVEQEMIKNQLAREKK